MFCNHEWKVLSSTVTESKFEIAMKTIRESSPNNTNTTIPHQMCCADRVFVEIVTCDKCGKLKRFVENI